MLYEALGSGTSATVTLRNYRKDGTMFYNELSIAPVHNAEGELTHFVGIGNDVTARIEAAEEQAALLKKMGCDFGQGFHFAQPMDQQAAGEFVRRSSSVAKAA